MTEAQCGTVRGYYRHYRLGEEACTPCRVAKREHERRRRENETPEQRTRRLLPSMAQKYAQQRLAQMHPSLYRALYQEERARLAEKWGLA